ncbi:BA75_04413T0 [Komagataella pastoris]|uniref:BA75_04413T0 n=1 Tax=Komagataella pastoris TaxID=4922 RepID=A0A1B2JHG3_PICPA|nr:BA75_04413T0 [Komagataella pastoris]
MSNFETNRILNGLERSSSGDNLIFLHRTRRLVTKFLDQIFKPLWTVRIARIPLLNILLLVSLSFLLLRLSFHYHKLYTKSSLAATVATNIVLYGISDTLAQSIDCFNAPQLGAIRLNDIFPLNTTSSNGANDLNSEVSVFVDYGEEEQMIPVSFETPNLNSDVSPIPALRSSENDDRPCFQFPRFFGFVFWGFIMAFVQVVWYSFLNQVYVDEPVVVTVLERVLTDQLFFSPISLYSFYAYSTLILERGSRQDLHNKLMRLYISTLAVNFCVWFPVQFINFLIMPKKFQVLFSSSVGVLWNCFLSMKNASSPL